MSLKITTMPTSTPTPTSTSTPTTTTTLICRSPLAPPTVTLPTITLLIFPLIRPFQTSRPSTRLLSYPFLEKERRSELLVALALGQCWAVVSNVSYRFL